MLPIIGFLVVTVVIAILVYKVFFAFRKKHIGSGNIFYVTAGDQFNEVIEVDQKHLDNLQVLTAKSVDETLIKDAIITHDFTNRDQPFIHNILISGMPIGRLDHSTAIALKQEKDELGIHGGIIYGKVRIMKDANGDVTAVALDLPPIDQLSKVLSNRSFEDSAQKFLRLE